MSSHYADWRVEEMSMVRVGVAVGMLGVGFASGVGMMFASGWGRIARKIEVQPSWRVFGQ